MYAYTLPGEEADHGGRVAETEDANDEFNPTGLFSMVGLAATL